MQFVVDGPDVPDRLMQAHEEGRVVFFCGAGISYPAGLCDFKWLVVQLVRQLRVPPDPVRQAAIDAERFDTAIGLLEGATIGGRERVRRELVSILKPDTSAPNATTTHQALLTLAKNRSGQTRLITTNFDRLFEEVIKDQSLQIQRFKAPLLPIPKNRWDGLIYLHGLITKNPTEHDLNSLVLSSGDFGLAYLVERWAARFVSDLFRRYSVCFVGYSISDPVLHYMTDALAADRMLGESPPEMFAFGSYREGEEPKSESEWRVKNVTPILYHEEGHHRHLHYTLRAWASNYGDGVRGAERIVVECAMARPSASTKEDDFVGRLKWALSDPSGRPAQHFAEMIPVPSLEWLGPLCESSYGYHDLDRFGVTRHSEEDKKTLKFSLTSRPASYQHEPWTALVSGVTPRRWDKVFQHLAHWLTRHVDDPALILWIAESGGQPHDQFGRVIQDHLERIDHLRRNGDADALESVSRGAPRTIPRPMMRTLWRFVLAGRLQAPEIWHHDLYSWVNRFDTDGLTTTSRRELREMLAPRLSLREGLRDRWGDTEAAPVEEIINCEVWVSEYAHDTFGKVKNTARWKAALPDLLPDFCALLREAMDMMRELSLVDCERDWSHLARPSISDDWESGDPGWTALIDLTRDAWIATAACDPARARRVVDDWRQAPYPLFRRLEFFASAQGDVIPPRLALDRLLSDDHFWLWSEETEQEALALLIALVPRLSRMELAKLQRAILAGFDVESEEWHHIRDRRIWRRLERLQRAGVTLGKKAQASLDVFCGRYDDATPSPPPQTGAYDQWDQKCRNKRETAAKELCALASKAEWPEVRWDQALRAWSTDELAKWSWRQLATVLENAPDALLLGISHGLGLWLKAVAQKVDDEAPFFRLCERILGMEHGDGVNTEEPVLRAINHPVGHVTEAMLRWWHRNPLEDGQKLPLELKPVFTALCDTRIERFRHGRVLLAANAVTLFRVDRVWTTEHLVPLFEWTRPLDARAAWGGFLRAGRNYRPLMRLIKKHFLNTAEHVSEIPKHSRVYAAMLTFVALDPGDMFTRDELARATRDLPQKGLVEVAHTLANSLDSAEEDREAHWKSRIRPYLNSVWPTSRECLSQATAEAVALLCIAARKSFPDAVDLLRDWFQPLPRSGYVVRKLNTAKLPGLFPKATLMFLDGLIDARTCSSSHDLKETLREIGTAAPELESDRRFQRLELI
ncbi:MAG: SIR2 family protein [Alphaproteobacteria bacterium]|nr:SIR2 family protein [Alphaproteobacteria bacterium]